MNNKPIPVEDHEANTKKAIWDLEEFVIKTCGNRPPSHSDKHMRDVVEGALRIYFYEVTNNEENKYQDPFFFMICVVCWLHDVADHKYIKSTPGLVCKLKMFLVNFTAKYAMLVENTEYEKLFTSEKIMAITERFSFSRQKKYGMNDWSEVLGETGIKLRDIGSDADKHKAIGRDGIVRCAQYTIEKAEEDKEKINRGELCDRVEKHYNEKLKIISSDYMRTERGMEIAVELDREMLKAMKDLRNGTLNLK
jgi:hypothetical protein